LELKRLVDSQAIITICMTSIGKQDELRRDDLRCRTELSPENQPLAAFFGANL
jgi:hypothetical protein